MSEDTKGKILAYIIMGLLLVAVLLSYNYALENSPTLREPTTTSTTMVCHEDMPCWDCTTMGNKVCGPGKG